MVEIKKPQEPIKPPTEDKKPVDKVQWAKPETGIDAPKKPSEWDKSQWDKAKEKLREMQKKLSEKKIKFEEAVAKEKDTRKDPQDFKSWESPIPLTKKKESFSPLLTSSQVREKTEEDLKKIEDEYMNEMKKSHWEDVKNLIAEKKLGDIDKTARVQGYNDVIRSNISPDKILGLDKKIWDMKKRIENTPSFKKLSAQEKINELQKQEKSFRERLLEESVGSSAAKIEKFQNLTPEEKGKPENNISELKKDLKNSLGLDDQWIDNLVAKLLDEKVIKDQIIKNVTEKGTFAAGVDINSPLGKEINKKQQDTLGNIISLMGDRINLDNLPLDIKQRLLLEDASNSHNSEKLIDAGNIPDVLDKQIGRTRKEIFRQKSWETDQEYTQRVDDRLKKNTGLSMKEVSKVTGKLSPFVKFLADMLAPLGALMDWEVGEFWRNYMKQNWTPEQQSKWANNSQKYYGKEGETVMSKNRESHKKNLADYAWCNNPDLMPTVNKMRANQSKYEAVSQKLSEKTGGKKKIGWEVIAAIHYREGDMDFGTYLHNGDKLGSPTVSVPAGISFPNSTEWWVDAAVDALNREVYLENMSTASPDWLANIAEYAEKYNGPAYRNQGKNSPYVWAWSQWIGVAGLIKVDHGPITNQQDKRLGIMPIVLELAGYTTRGQISEEQKNKLKSDAKETTETAWKDPAQWFKNNANKPYWSTGEGKYDCMTSTNTALGLPFEHHVKSFWSQYILWKDKNGAEKPQDLWGVSMAAAIYAGKLRWPTSESSKQHPIEMKDGWYGWIEKASNPENMEYYIEENVAKRVNEGSGINDVTWDGKLVHYSKKIWVQGIVDDIKKRLPESGQYAMMGATGNGTNLGGHEWLISREGDKLMVYEATNYQNKGVTWVGTELSQYLSDNRRSQYNSEAIILGVSQKSADGNQDKKSWDNSKQNPPKTINTSKSSNSDKLTANELQKLPGIFLGDSITTAMYGSEDDPTAKAQTDKYGKYYEIGASSGKILKFVENAVKSKPPFISILAGTNDVGNNDPIPNIKSMVALCQSNWIPLFLWTLPPIRGKENKVESINNQIREIKWVTIVDYARLPIVTSDSLHPDSKSYKMMRDLVFSVIKGKMWTLT